LIDKWSKNLIKPDIPKGGGMLDLVTDEYLQRTEQFLHFYHQRLESTDTKQYQLISELGKLIELKTNLQKDIDLQSSKTNEVHEALVVVQCKSTIQGKLKLTYIITGASWKASYDMRVGAELNDLSITYYGHIINSTGEDWTNTKVTLSTAQPSIQGRPPDLKPSLSV